jgi:hypothetical protein
MDEIKFDVDYIRRNAGRRYGEPSSAQDATPSLTVKELRLRQKDAENRRNLRLAEEQQVLQKINEIDKALLEHVEYNSECFLTVSMKEPLARRIGSYYGQLGYTTMIVKHTYLETYKNTGYVELQLAW